LNNYRIHGHKPVNVAVIHGGPGAPGELAPLAKELGKTHGVLEPFQTQASLKGQLQELQEVLDNVADLPVTLIGHSWGALLSFIFTAHHPSYIKKLILISSAVFEDSYVQNINNTRLNRLSREERAQIESLSQYLEDPAYKNKNDVFFKIGELSSKADAYDPLPHKNEFIQGEESQYFIYKSVWNEAQKIRSTGELLNYGKQIQCPVVALQGDYDSHLAEGVEGPLSKVLKDFKFILLKKCGHYPWYERQAKDAFYEILKKTISIT
jgi:pimeloyl-ACP methyl ester carboxylesterase